jgi:uncharacterized protein YqgV (UPF0045/DUF77 family)
MEVSVEISLYPLTEDYETVVLTFLDELEKAEAITYSTNGMSTQVFGEASHVFPLIGELFEKIQSTGKAMLVLKAGPGRLEYKGRHHR